MARAQTLVQLTDELLALLDQRAAARGVSRSFLIREAIEAHLAADVEADITRRLVEGYERVPQGAPDEWGDPSAYIHATAREAHRRLDAEERAAGHEPW